MENGQDGKPTTELARTEDAALLRPVAPITDILSAQQATIEFIKEGLTEGVDYGTIKGSDGKVLFKAGSERLCSAFGVSAEYRITEQEIDHDREVEWTKRKKKWRNEHQGDRRYEWETEDGKSLGLYRYVVAVVLTNRLSGAMLGTGIGVCSTMESKYIDRPRELENTILKMAQKRALVGAALNVFCLSDRFTQDMEETAEEQATAAVDYGDPENMTTDQAKAWAMSEVGLDEHDFDVLKENSAVGHVSWLAVCRNARAINGKDTLPENLAAELENLVVKKNPGRVHDETEEQASGEASAPSGGAGQPATETGAESPAEPATTIKSEDVTGYGAGLTAPKDDGSGEPGASGARTAPSTSSEGQEPGASGSSASTASAPSGSKPEPSNWFEAIVSRETYSQLMAKAQDAGCDASEFTGDPLAETDDADTATLRFAKWLGTARAKKASALAVEAAQDARSGD